MNRNRRIFVTCYAVSGAAALVYQVAWTRLFSLQLGHTTAASSTVLAAFMGGLAAGAWIGGNVRADSGRPSTHSTGSGSMVSFVEPSTTSGRPELVGGRRLLTLYAAIEVFIGAIAVVLPGALQALVPALAWAYADGNAPTSFAMLRVAVSLLLVAVPAAAMGATFPIAVAWLAQVEGTHPASRPMPAAAAGTLYAANTAGAALGAISAGFWLIPAIGLRATTWIGITLNIAAAAGALWLARGQQADQVRQQRTRPAARAEGRLRESATARQGRPRGSAIARESRRRASSAARQPVDTVPRPVLAALAAGLSGFLALVYEVAWTRLLALVLGPTTYAFAIMAASFITGIALGSFVGTRVARRASNPAVWLGGTLILTVVSAPAAAWFAASRLPMLVAARVNAGAAFESMILQQVLAVAGVLLPTSIALGASFVLAVASATDVSTNIGKNAARVYVANTIGAVAGALFAGFLLIPRLGLQQTFVGISGLGAIGAILVVTAAVLPHRRPEGRHYKHRWRPMFGATALLAALAAVFTLFPAWDRQLLASGAYKYSRDLDPDLLDATLRAGRLEYYKEGAAGTVSVRRVAGSLALAIDGKVDASNAGDMLTQRLLGLLPVLLHPEPRDALVIGLGSGVTADAVLASGEVQHLDIVEISPEVVEASEYFERENRGVLRKPGVRLLVADGRSHLRLTSRQYDVIVSEPSNPWMAGVAALFTREFFEAARARLRPGGVFCQWAHTYEIAEQDLRSMVNTFASVFPDGTMWLVGESDLLLIGSAAVPLEPRLSAIAERSRSGSIPSLLADVGVPAGAAPFVLLSLFTGGAKQLTAFGDRAQLQTDDRMSLEFTAARAMYAPPDGNASRLKALAAGVMPAVVSDSMQNATAADWTARGNAALQAKAFDMARESFRRTLALDSRSASALRGLTEAAAQARRLAEETEWLKALATAEPDNMAVRVELSHVLATLGRIEEAIDAAREAARVDPARAEPLEQLASIFADAGDAMRLAPIADELVRRFPARDEGRYYQAAFLFLAGRTTEAEGPIRALLGANPHHPKGQNLLGVLCASLGRHECAQAAFDAALELNPRDPSVFVNLGYLRLARGDRAGAAAFFAEALAIDTTSEAARGGLAEARGAQ
jgi:spermidine synthase